MCRNFSKFLPNQEELLKNLRKENPQFRRLDKTVLLSTHILQEVDALCDRVIIINKGEIVLDQALEELRSKQEQIIEKFYNLAQKVLTGMNSELYCYYCIGKQKGLDENIYFLFKAETKKEVSLLKNLIYININILTNNVKYTCEADIMMKNRLIEYRLLTTVINADS